MPVNYIPHPIRADAYDLIAQRAIGITYQNIRLRPIVVVATIEHIMVGFGAPCRAIGYIDPATPPANAVSYCGYLVAIGAGTMHGNMAFHVPPGWYYRILSQIGGGNANNLNEWWEWWL